MVSYATAESNSNDKYVRKCKFEISERSSEEYENTFEFYSSNSTGLTSANIKADFNNGFGFLINNRKLKLEGPSLHSECNIYDINRAKYPREFGYIQTSKKFYQRTFDNVITCTDFQSNLLDNKNEVLDADGEMKPFYSRNSYYKLPADEYPHKNTIKLIFDDYPSGITNLCIEGENLQQVERHQIFYIYIVMRYLGNDGQYQYKILHTFDWFLYFKWINNSRNNNYRYEYNYGVNCHDGLRDLPDFNISQTCNNDQVEYSIDLNTLGFRIIKPTYLSGDENYRQKIKNAVIIRNQKEREEEINNEFW